MSLSITVRAMVDAGCTGEQIAAVVAAHEGEAEKKRAAKRAKNAARMRDYRAAERAQSDAHSEALHARARTPPKKRGVPPTPPLLEKNLPPDTPSEEANASSSPKGDEPKKTPREILLECLSPETADGVLAHRKAMRRPLTGRAAQLLAKGFLATADPNAAADMMIARGWQGFKPDWFDNERRSNGQQKQGQSRKGSISDVAPGFIKRIDEQFAYLDEVRSPHGLAEGGPTVRLLPSQRGK